MMRALRRMILLTGLLAVAPFLCAHEFWMLPASSRLPAGQSVTLSLFVGERFTGVPVAFSPALVANLRQWRADGSTELAARSLAGAASPAISVRLWRPGGYVLALDTHPSFIELPAERFTDYLRQEGLQSVIQARERSGTTATPGRERYRRNVKAIVHAGEGSDSAFAQRTMQRLEIVPASDPPGLAAPAPLAFKIFFEGRPLAGALLKLWHRAPSGLTLLEQVTGIDGRVEFVLPTAGLWMASVVHMVPVEAEPGVDWDSYWGNLTFSIR
jgi:uncharacterized GH25 family protein